MKDKLKDGQGPSPIHELALLKEHSAKWISERVTIRNAKKLEKVVHCWGKTGLLAIWTILCVADSSGKAGGVIWKGLRESWGWGWEGNYESE